MVRVPPWGRSLRDGERVIWHTMLVHGSRWLAVLCLMPAWCSQAAVGATHPGASSFPLASLRTSCARDRDTLEIGDHPDIRKVAGGFRQNLLWAVAPRDVGEEQFS